MLGSLAILVREAMPALTWRSVSLTPDVAHCAFVDAVARGDLSGTETAASQATDLLPGLRRQRSVVGVRDAVDSVANCSRRGADRVILLKYACTTRLPDGCRLQTIATVSHIARIRLLVAGQAVSQPQQGTPLVRVKLAQAHSGVLAGQPAIRRRGCGLLKRTTSASQGGCGP